MSLPSRMNPFASPPVRAGTGGRRAVLAGQDGLTCSIGNSIIIKKCLKFFILKKNDTSKNGLVIRQRDFWFNLMEKYGFTIHISKFYGNHKTFTADHADFLERRYVFIIFVERLLFFRLNNLFSGNTIFIRTMSTSANIAFSLKATGNIHEQYPYV
jgi:hypothetical protein